MWIDAIDLNFQGARERSGSRETRASRDDGESSPPLSASVRSVRKRISSGWGLESPPGFSLCVWAIYCTYPRSSIPATLGVGTEAS